jgi:hypothetical protein
MSKNLSKKEIKLIGLQIALTMKDQGVSMDDFKEICMQLVSAHMVQELAEKEAANTKPEGKYEFNIDQHEIDELNGTYEMLFKRKPVNQEM